MLVLDEVLGLKMSNFTRHLEIKRGINDYHRVKVAMSKDLCFRGMEIREEEWRKETELQRDESSLGSDGFTHKARGQQVAAIDSSNSSIGHGRFLARPSDDHEDSCLLNDIGKPSRECRRKISQIGE